MNEMQQHYKKSFNRDLEDLRRQEEELRQKRVETFHRYFHPYLEAVKELSSTEAMEELQNPFEFPYLFEIYDMDTTISNGYDKHGAIIGDCITVRHHEGSTDVPLSIMDFSVEEYRAILRLKKNKYDLYMAQRDAQHTLKKIERLKEELDKASKMYDEKCDQISTLLTEEFSPNVS